LVGTIAYPVFNGKDYDIYLGQADGSGSLLYRKGASQPAFSPDGSRIAFHSWRLDSWGLMTIDVSGRNEILVANFVEDQLPTWSPDGRDIVLLSRREGDRKSRLIRVGSSQDRTEGVVIGEGEYPSLGLDGRLVFKGWGNTAPGLRTATISQADIQVLTDRDEDTAPAPSPDGQKIAFMSRRDGNWEIYVVNADGSGLQRLTDDPAEDGLPTWSPDGRAIAFVSRRGESWAIWAMTPSGDGQRLLFAMEGSPDGFVGKDLNSSRGWTEERISWTE
jgi:TolB protein